MHRAWSYCSELFHYWQKLDKLESPSTNERPDRVPIVQRLWPARRRERGAACGELR